MHTIKFYAYQLRQLKGDEIVYRLKEVHSNERCETRKHTLLSHVFDVRCLISASTAIKNETHRRVPCL